MVIFFTFARSAKHAYYLNKWQEPQTILQGYTIINFMSEIPLNQKHEKNI